MDFYKIILRQSGVRLQMQLRILRVARAKTATMRSVSRSDAWIRRACCSDFESRMKPNEFIATTTGNQGDARAIDGRNKAAWSNHEVSPLINRGGVTNLYIFRCPRCRSSNVLREALRRYAARTSTTSRRPRMRR